MNCYTCHGKINDQNHVYFGYSSNRIYICDSCWKDNLGNLKFYCDHSEIENLQDHCCVSECTESVSFIDIYKETSERKSLFSRRQILICHKCYDFHIGIPIEKKEDKRTSEWISDTAILAEMIDYGVSYDEAKEQLEKELKDEILNV